MSAGAVEGLAEAVAARVPASLAAYRDGVSAAPASPAAVPLAALREADVFEATLGAFAAGYGPADLRALVSYWSQFYLAALATPALTALVRLGRPLPLAFETTSLELDAAGRPARLLVRADGPAQGPGLAGLVEGHLRPFVETCRARCGIAPRVLWGNAAVILDHVAGELGLRGPGQGEIGRGEVGQGEIGRGEIGQGEVGEGEPEGGDAPARAEVAACLGWRAGPACARTPLAGALCPGASGCPRRRVCCLRRDLPGVPSCGALCPLECARRPLAR